jgi:hypothetical protein
MGWPVSVLWAVVSSSRPGRLSSREHEEDEDEEEESEEVVVSSSRFVLD